MSRGKSRVGGWGDPIAGPDVLEEKNTCYPCLESNHDSSTVQPIVESLHKLSYPGPIIPVVGLLYLTGYGLDQHLIRVRLPERTEKTVTVDAE